jgi:hypothetical protein
VRGHLFDLGIVVALNLAHLLHIVVGNEVDGHTLATKATRTTDAVNVFLKVARKVVVDHERHLSTTRLRGLSKESLCHKLGERKVRSVIWLKLAMFKFIVDHMGKESFVIPLTQKFLKFKRREALIEPRIPQRRERSEVIPSRTALPPMAA